jgi:hypothetical protein
MNIFLTIFIFALVLFLYLHIYFHHKVSNDLEVYTIEQPSKEKLEEICDFRQPVIFDFENAQLKENCNLATLEDVYGAFDIKIRNVEDDDDDTKEMYLPFLLKEAVHLFQNDDKKVYISENNSDFLNETGTIKIFKHNDAFLRPHMVSRCIYDIWSGSVGCQTPLRHNLNYRNYIYITNGSAKLKLIPPCASRYLDIIKDYDNFEYRSPVNPWHVQEKYKASFGKIKVLDLNITPGQIIFIPAYWWYSIEYTELSCICSFQYRTYMNTLAILPEIILSLLQKQNIKRDVVKKVDSE